MKAGSLCTGIGGLDLAVEAHFGAELVWYSELEPAPCKVLEREWPGAPNLGDLTVLDWAEVPTVDVLTAGFPCQPFSHAGKRKGKNDVRHLWPFIAEAVRVLRPRWVCLENVAGHLTLGFGDVLRDLAEAGFDAEWCVLRASDVGACHQRARLFIVATDAADRLHGDERRGVAGAPTSGERGGPRDGGRPSPRRDAPADAPGTERRGAQQQGVASAAERAAEPGERVGSGPIGGEALADTHQAGPQGPQPEGRRHLSAGSGGAPTNATGLTEREPADEAHTVTGGREARSEPRRRSGDVAWGVYEPAIRRHERAFGRPAPRPVDTAGRLSPAFVEWMMGYPQGWVDGLTRTQALKALGNAVVPQQGLAALRELAPVEALEVAS